MKRFIYSSCALSIIIVLCIIISCGKEHTVDNGDDVSELVGTTWMGESVKHEKITVYFRGEDSGVLTEVYDDDYYGTETWRVSFSYKMSSKTKGVISFKEGDSYSGYYYVNLRFDRDNDTMYLFGNDNTDDIYVVLNKK